MAGDNEDGQEKTYDPTERKLEQAREKGNVPHSQEVSNLLIYVAVLVIVLGVGDAVLNDVSRLFVSMMSKAGNIAAPEGGQGLTDAAGSFLGELGSAFLPILGVLLLASLLPSVLQNTLVLSPDKIKPKAENLSVKKGFSKIFGGKNMFDFAKSMTTISVISVTVWLALDYYFGFANMLVRSPFQAALNQMADALAYLLIAMILVQAVITVADIFYQRFEHQRQLRMSHKEIQDERKQTEGDPEVKKRLQQLRQEKAQSRMMQEVPDSDVVLTNPTHYAVALKWRKGHDAAPRCVAKGVDQMALRIRQTAEESSVPVVERPEVARALHDAVEVDTEIPETFYKAIAVVLKELGYTAGGQRT